MFWDIFAPVSEKYEDFAKKIGFNSTWNTTLGDSIANIIGGGRFTNIFGTDAKIVFDWEEMLMKVGSNIPGIGKGFAAASHGTIGGVLFGIGGDTSMVFGNKTSFTYFTQKADCEYGVQKIEVNWAAPDPPGRFYTLPYFPVIVAVAGVWAMTGLTLALKYYWKYTSSNPWTVDMGGEHDTSTGPSLIKASTNYSAMENAMLLYPLLESRWLAAVKILHTFGYTKVQLSLKPGQIDQEQTLLESQLKDIEGKISLLKCKIKTLAKEVTTNAQLSTARPMFAPDILLERLAILNLELVDLGQILGKYMLTKASITEEIAEKVAALAKLVKP
jgi:hypothetical protein